MAVKILHNKFDKDTLRKKLAAEQFRRITLSFYKYVIIENPQELRDAMWKAFCEMEILGRIYIAREGINAQISVPEHRFDAFQNYLDTSSYFKNVPLKIAVEDDGKSFYKLIVRLKKKIVADGLKDDFFDVTNVGNHLSAQEFNEAMENENTIVVDMRNHYESEIGKFENALTFDADTFRHAMEQSVDELKDKKNKKILLYCTGGIRCEKASAYMKHHGFNDVNQLYGGIISYTHQIKSDGLKNKFIGKNFVFDERMGERIGGEIISKCHQCGEASDRHVNCANDDCHLLFIQCEHCAEKYKGCCTPRCIEIIALPVEEQIKLRKGKKKENAHAVYKSRLRPKLSEYFVAEQKK